MYESSLLMERDLHRYKFVFVTCLRFRIRYKIQTKQNLVECLRLMLFILKHVSVNACGHHQVIMKSYYFFEEEASSCMTCMATWWWLHREAETCCSTHIMIVRPSTMCCVIWAWYLLIVRTPFTKIIFIMSRSDGMKKPVLTDNDHKTDDRFSTPMNVMWQIKSPSW